MAKSDAKPTLSRNYFNFTTEYIVWARKNEKVSHYFNCNLMEQLNGGARMSDVWRIPFLASWELKCGKHPTQKPLRLLYRIILSSTHEGDTILDPLREVVQLALLRVFLTESSLVLTKVLII